MYTFQVMWSDLDANNHMKNTAYSDYSGQTRMMYFSQNGFTMNKFREIALGPVVLNDTLSYYKELFLLEEFNVTHLIDGLSEDGSRFRFVNEFFNIKNNLVAHVKTEGAWFDLKNRKIVVPPHELNLIITLLPKTISYADIIRKSHSTN